MHRGDIALGAIGEVLRRAAASFAASELNRARNASGSKSAPLASRPAPAIVDQIGIQRPACGPARRWKRASSGTRPCRQRKQRASLPFIASAVTAIRPVRGRPRLASSCRIAFARPNPSSTGICRSSRTTACCASRHFTRAARAVLRGFGRQTEKFKLTQDHFEVDGMIVGDKQTAPRFAEAERARNGLFPCKCRPAQLQARFAEAQMDGECGALARRSSPPQRRRPSVGRAGGRSRGQGQCRQNAASSNCRPA